MGELAWAFCVVSSGEQADSLPHQRAWAEGVCAEKGWTLDRIFEDVASGKLGPRRLLRELLVELSAIPRANRPQWVLTIRLDRLGRGRAVDTQLGLHDLLDLGVRLWTREAGEVKLDSAMDEMIAGIKAGIARMENEVKRDKLLAVYARKRRLGQAVGNKRPYGLTIAPDGKDAPLEPQAEAVRRAFALRLSGMGYWSIGRELAKFAPPHSYKTGERIVRWSNERVCQLLSKEAYCGTLIDDVTFHRVQRMRDGVSRARNEGKHPWPLNGAIRCYCGRGMNGHFNGGHRYYLCRAVWNHGGRARPNVKAGPLEQQFRDLISEMASDSGLIDTFRRGNAGPDLAVIDRAIRDATLRIAENTRLRDRVWAIHAAGNLRDEDVQERLDTLKAQREGLEGSIREMEAQQSVAIATITRDRDGDALIQRAASTWDRATPAEQRRLAGAISAYLGGLCVEEGGTLSQRRALDPKPQLRRKNRG